MGNACTSDDDIKRDALVKSVRERQREEDQYAENLKRQRVNFEARQKAIEAFNLHEGEAVSGRRRSFPCFTSCMDPELTNFANHRSQLLALLEKHQPQEESPVICFTSEIEKTGAPMFTARDHMGRQVEVLVPNPGAQCGDDDHFVPFFHPSSPLSCEAVTNIDAINPTDSRRLRFLEKSEDVEEHLKRMAPVMRAE